MAGKEKPRRSKRARRIRRWIFLGVLGAAVAIGYWQIKPLLMQGSKAVYEPFTVTQGDVRTSMSMSGAISVGAQETISNQSSRSFTDMVTVREIFVEASQRVHKDDKLIQLSNGDIYRAGIEGMVNEIRVSQGDWVRPNATLMEICDVDHLIVTISVDEFDISRLAVGQQCAITVLPLGVSFDTQISHIDRVSNAMGWVASYTVTADANAPENVWPGMQASVEIEQEAALGVPMLPMRAISFDENGQPHVLKKTGEETYERAEIEVGLSDGMNVQIVSGLSLGDTVWAQADVEQTQAAISVAAVYKRLFGEKVQIIDRTGSGSGRGGRGGFAGMPAGMTMPEGLSMPEGFEMPEGMPQGMNFPQSAATGGEASGMPQDREFPRDAATAGEAGMRQRPQTGGDGA